MNPLGVLNDGLMELVYRTGYVSASGAINLFFQPHGKLIYDENFRIIRCKNVKIVNKKIDPATNELEPQDVNIDGEDLIFKNYIKYEVMPSSIDVIVDFQHIFDKTYDVKAYHRHANLWKEIKILKLSEHLYFKF